MAVADDFFRLISEGLEEMIRSTIGDIIEVAKKDARSFLEDTREKLQRWVTLLSNGDLQKWEFEYLVESQAELAKMHALKVLGIAKANIDRFREGLISLIISSAFSLVRV